MAYRKDWAQPQQGAQGFARTHKTYGRTVNISVADNVTGNTIGAFMVPAGFVATSIIAVNSDMDNGATMTFSIGDAASGTRYLGATSGQAAGTTTAIAPTGLLFKNTVDTEILVTIVAQAGTPVAGTIDLRLQGYIE
jgi:hypothetical protein